MKICLIVAFILFVSTNVLFAQTSDLVRIEYTGIPQVDSKNSINRFRAFVNFPIKLGWDGYYLIPGVEYRNFDLDIKDPVPFEKHDMGQFQMFRASLAIVVKLKNHWNFALRSGAEVASNFEENSIQRNDLNFTGSVYFIKDRSGDDFEKASRLILGLNYSTNAGRPFPLPIVNYYHEFKPNWSYSVGTPKSNLKYNWNDKNAVQAFVTLDGFFSNIQNNRVVNYSDGTTASADNISMTLILGGLGYEHSFTKHIIYYGYAGHTLYNQIRLRDTDRNNLYKLNEKNTFYVRTGIKFKL
jgi:hypothetical protein